MIRLAIFDLDGTVLDTVASIAHFGNLALSKNGIDPIETAEYKYLAGNGISRLIHNMLTFRGCDTPVLYERVYRDYDDAYNADVAYLTTSFDGLPEVLDEFKRRGVALAIVSNKPDFAARGVTEAVYGRGYFDFVMGQTPDFPLKPDPTSVLSVIERFGVKREEVLYVGDTSTDMLTGRNAGLRTVGVLWGFRDREELVGSGADVIVQVPRALLGELDASTL